MNLLKGPLVLKLAALAAAVLTYVYIHNELYRVEPAREIDPSYKLLKLTAKSVPVKVRLSSEPPEGYRIVEDEVVAKPAFALVVGPEQLIEETSVAQTSLVDVSEYTQTTTRRVALESVAGTHLAGEPYLIDVTVPIRPVGTKQFEAKAADAEARS